MKFENISCKICAQPSEFLCETPNEHSRTRVLRHYRCTNCGLVFVGDKIDNDELGVAYSTLDQDSYYEEIKVETGRKFETSVHDLAALASKDGEVIDLGTGNGGFVERLIQNGFVNVSAHEIPGSDLSNIEKIGGKIYLDFDYKSIPPDHFSAVTLLDVAEHVLNPRYLFEQCHRILESGGIVYFHTPMVTTLDRAMHVLQKIPILKKIGRAWQRGRTSIFHQQNYTPKSIELLMNECGFESLNLAAKNELSWSVQRYVRIYLCEKQGVPKFLIPILTALLYPFLATNFFNSNKAIVWAKKRG